MPAELFKLRASNKPAKLEVRSVGLQFAAFNLNKCQHEPYRTNEGDPDPDILVRRQQEPSSVTISAIRPTPVSRPGGEGGEVLISTREVVYYYYCYYSDDDDDNDDDDYY